MITRRRMISILAGSAALPAFGAAAAGRVTRWRGVALGAEATIVLDHPDAAQLVASAVQEIRRLERIFSLYDKDSQLSRLNRLGRLGQPAFEMVELLSHCATLHGQTSGAFDPTVQTLWSLYARELSAGKAPDDTQIDAALKRTGWRHVNHTPALVEFDRPGVQLTLNGVAQGYIADKVRALFELRGVRNVLVNTGEISALGQDPGGRIWRVKPGRLAQDPVPLKDTSIATSAPLGTTLDDTGRIGHILDPRRGTPATLWSEVSVITRSAARADGLSTAFCLMSEQEIETAKGDARVILRPT